jgi:hypothetical protein
MADAKKAARKRFAKTARRIRGLCSDLLAEERRLEAASDLGEDKEAEQLAATAGCVVVDHLRPAIQALEEAAEPIPASGDAQDSERGEP